MVYPVHLVVLYITTVIHVTAVPNIKTMCPNLQNCEREPQFVTNQELSCCQPCSCSDICGLVGVCCPGKVPMNHSHTGYPCVTQAQIYSKYLIGEYGPNYGLSKYRIVTSCHSPVTDVDSVKNNTNEHISRCLQARTAEDLNFVTGTISGITYLNKHCAICNGETKYRKWRLSLYFQKDLESISSIEDIDSYILSSRAVMSLPSNVGDLSLTVCYEDMIDKCNKTGQWNLHNKNLELKCEQSDSIYYHIKNNKLKVYKNIFCFLCNMPDNTKVGNNCEDLLEEEHTQKSGNMYSFIAFIILPEKKNVLSKSKINICNKTEIFDPFKKRCLKLYCPPGSFPLDGKCQTVFQNIIGFTTEAMFYLSLEKEIDRTTRGLEELLYELVEHVKTFVEDKKAKCGYCNADISVLTMDKYVFRIALVSSHECPLLHYLKGLSKLFTSSPFPVLSKYNNASAYLTASTETESFFSNDYLDLITLNYFTFCKSTTIFSDSIVYCPSINVPVVDLESIEIHKSLKEELMLTSPRNGNGTVRLCYSQYKALHAVGSSSSPMFSDKNIYLGLFVYLFRYLL